MVEIFSTDWLKLPPAAKKKSLSSVTNLDNLYVVILTDNADLKTRLAEEVIRLGLNPLHSSEVEESVNFLKVHGSKIVLILSSFSLMDEKGRFFREQVLENTNDTPFAIVTELSNLEELSPARQISIRMSIWV